jgi:benzoate-CoA ligase family protein
MLESPTGSARHLNATDEILGPPLARGQANEVAILFADEKITFAELNARVNRWGNALKSYLNKGDRALLLLKDTPVFVAAFLGIIRIGAVAIPFSARAAAKDLAFALEDSGAKVLLIDDEFLPLFHEALALGGHKPGLVVVRGAPEPGMISSDELVRNASSELRTEPTTADDMAFWLYTSGTTGTPKGAIHAQADVTAGDTYMQWFGAGPGERIFSSSKLFFAFGITHTLIGGLRMGATIILFDGVPETPAIAEVVNRYRPTIMLSVPTMYRNLLRDGCSKQPGFKSVRHYITAGEGLPEGLYHRWKQDTGVGIVEGLGTTETMFMMITGTPADHRAGATGKPAPYMEVKLIDEQGRPVTAPDTPGVLWVKGGSVCRGYWRQPEKTAAVFQDGWFRTGDVFTIDRDGWWHHHGRGDDLLKISGQWVSPTEIEECAITVPGVSDAAVIGLKNQDGLVRLTLFLVPENGASQELEKAVQEKLLATLSVYKCPRNVRFVEAIPRTATGKVQRYRLRQMASEGASSTP